MHNYFHIFEYFMTWYSSRLSSVVRLSISVKYDETVFFLASGFD